MEVLLLILVVMLVLGMQKEAEQLLATVAVSVLVLVGLAVVLAGFYYFPVATCITLGCLGAVGLVFLCRWVYHSWFSPEARLHAAHQRMNKHWYRLSWHIVQLERNGYGGTAKDNRRWAESVLTRTKAEFELYNKVAPRMIRDKPYPYGEWLEDLEKRMNVALDALAKAEEKS